MQLLPARNHVDKRLAHPRSSLGVELHTAPVPRRYQERVSAGGRTECGWVGMVGEIVDHNSATTLADLPPLTVSPDPASSCMKHPSKHTTLHGKAGAGRPSQFRIPRSGLCTTWSTGPDTWSGCRPHLPPASPSRIQPTQVPDMPRALVLAPRRSRASRHLAPRAPPSNCTPVSAADSRSSIIPVRRRASGNRGPGPNGNLGETPTLARPNGKNLLFEREECASNGKNLRPLIYLRVGGTPLAAPRAPLLAVCAEPRRATLPLPEIARLATLRQPLSRGSREDSRCSAQLRARSRMLLGGCSGQLAAQFSVGRLGMYDAGRLAR